MSKCRRRKQPQPRVAAQPGVAVRLAGGSGATWRARLQHLQVQGRPRTLHRLPVAWLPESAQQLEGQGEATESVAVEVARPAAGNPGADRSGIP